MDVFELQAILGLNADAYNEGLDQADKKAGGFASGVKKAFSAIGKVTMAAVGAATTAIAGLATASVKGYADYEQLVGGVETLFSSLDGTVSAAPEVLANAEKAYMSAGLSANEYMETVTSFSAALISSLNGDYSEAARVSDMAITDMADNANKMGTSMESIQSAYAGFAKQNYTMLDNLKLGYGGTRTEMERLLADAQEITGVQYDIENLNDVYEAIHVIQGELGIAGATQKEAMTTISGSMNAMKSAWSNLIVGFARGDADISQLITNLVGSASAFIDNVVPRAIEAVEGIGQFIVEIAPVIGETLSTILTDALPGMVDAAVSLIQSIMQALIDNLPTIIDAGIQIGSSLISGVITALPLIIEGVTTLISEISSHLTGENLASIIKAGLELIKTLADAMIKNMPVVLQSIKSIITSVLEYLAGDGISEILQMGFDLIMSLAEGFMNNLDATLDAITEIIDAVIDFLTGDGLPMLLEMGLQLIMSMIEGFVEKLPDVVNSIMDIITAVVDFLAGDGLLNLLSMGIELIFALAQGILENLPAVVSSLATLLAETIAYILENLPQFIATGIELVGQIIVGLIEAIPEIIAALPEIFMAIINAFAEVDWLSVGSNIIDGIVNGIGGAVSRLWDAAVAAAKNALAKIKNVLGIASPSKVFRDQIGKMIPEGMAIGIEANTNEVEDAVSELASLTTEPFAGMDNVISFPDVTTGKGGTLGGVTINVYPREGQSEEDIADYVMERLNQEYEKAGRALA